MTITILGGDARQKYAEMRLRELGYEVYVAPLQHPLDEAKRGADVLLLPIPATKDGKHLNAKLETPLPLLDLSCTHAPRIFGGGFSASFLQLMRGKGKRVTDLLEVPAFVEENAVLTAEAALGVGMEACHMPPRGNRVGVIGYGRIASRLTRLLLLLGARVSVFAIQEDARRGAILDGAEAYPIEKLKSVIPTLSLLYNTAPAPILTPSILEGASTLAIVELASGKENISLGNNPQVTLTFAHSLPGKILPASAGVVIANTLHQFLQKEGLR